MTWIRVSDRLPAPGARVDIWIGGERETDVVREPDARLESTGNPGPVWLDAWGYPVSGIVTHWMTTPAPPDEDTP